MDRRTTGDREVAPTVHCSCDVPIVERSRNNRRWGHRRYSLAAFAFALSLEALIPSAIARNDMPAPWAAEQMPGGSVDQRGNALEIRDKGGCTVWYTRELLAPVTISYDAMVVSDDGERVSDLNCFWMATDPALPGPFFSRRPRSGKFSDYDSLRAYYVGFGGNNNTTTRFRRYPGDGTRPLLPEHDLRASQFLLEPNRWYHIEVSATDRTALYRVNGKTVFAYRDQDFLSRGWFGFRTVSAHIKIKHFAVCEGAKP